MVILLVPRPLDVVMDETDSAVVPHILSEQAIKIIIINYDNDNSHTILPFFYKQEIMHNYWRISMNVRLASVALQR